MSAQSTDRISWDQVKDRHCHGRFQAGHAWIRLRTEEEASGVYVRLEGDESWEKHVPDSGEKWSLEDAKAMAELGLQALLATTRVMSTLKT
jgi:hypothetical protein